MRHGHGLRKLNRTSSHRLAMLQNMMNSIIEHEVIKTTVPKAKELRRVIEPMITLAKVDTVANRRLAFNRLRDRDSVTKLFTDLGPGAEVCEQLGDAVAIAQAVESQAAVGHCVNFGQSDHWLNDAAQFFGLGDCCFDDFVLNDGVHHVLQHCQAV